jgi:hypothetical protein
VTAAIAGCNDPISARTHVPPHHCHVRPATLRAKRRGGVLEGGEGVLEGEKRFLTHEKRFLSQFVTAPKAVWHAMVREG